MQSLIVGKLRKHPASFALSNLALILIVAVAYRFHLNTAIVGLMCLLVIVLHAVIVGFASSAIVSIVAGACLVYFFAYPIFDFRIDDPVDAVALLVFLIVSNVLAWFASKVYTATRDSRRQLTPVENPAHMAVWNRDPRTNRITFSSESNKIYGLAAGQQAITYDEWLGVIHPEDREQVRVHNSDALTQTNILEEEFRVIWPDGSVHWLLGKSTVFADEIGRPVRVAGVNIDITERKRAEAALRESEERMRFAQQVAGIGTFDWNIETGVSTWTPELEALYGLTAGGFPGTHSAWEDLVHPDDRALSLQAQKEAFETGIPVEAEWRTILLDGRVRWILGRWQVFKNAAGKPLRMMGVNMDVTDRKYMEEALRQSEERFRLAIQATNDAIWDIDLATGTVSWNETYATHYGRPPETSKSRQWWIDRIHPEDRERASGELRAAIDGSESTWVCEYRFQRADGAWAYIHDRAYIARDPSGSARRVIGAMQDLTERKRAQEIENQLASDLASSRDEIRALAASLIRAQEDERRRVSRDLHDQICYQLASLAVDIGNLAVSPLAPENLRANLTAIRARVVQTSQETHHIAYQMHTAILNDLGLVASLNALCRQFSDQYPNVAMNFKNSGPLTSVPSEVATCVYRVAQESLQNAAKHSGAKNVSVRLGFKKRAIVLTIHDDGAGFDPNVVKSRGGIGLISMKERTHLVNGELTITSQPGHGTQVSIEAPLPVSATPDPLGSLPGSASQPYSQRPD